MTETSPVASTAQLPGALSDADEDTQFDYLAMQGLPLPLVELRHRDADGRLLPWDGEAMGELEIRGPVGRRRLLRDARPGRALDGRRLVQDRRRRLDPSARVHPDQGPLEGRDQVGRRVDLVGRARERADGAPGDHGGGGDRRARREVGRAAARRGRAARGSAATGDELRAFLAPDFAKFWLPDRFEFIAEIPKTSVGKFRKTELREMFASEPAPADAVKAIVLHEVDGALALEDVPDPEGPNVVEVRAAGVNYADVLIRRGRYPQMPEFPFVPGNEVAGELDGRRVVAFTPKTGGGYAERTHGRSGVGLPASGRGVVCGRRGVPADLPDRLHPAAPAGSGDALRPRCSSTPARAESGPRRSSSRRISERRDRDGQQRGEARLRGRRRRRRGVGYDEIDDLRVDVVIDPVGGDIFKRSLPLLKPLGQIVAIGFTGGLWEDPSVTWLVGRNVGVQGVYLAG